MVLPLVMTVLAALVRTVLVRTVLALLLMVQKILALTVLVLITALAHVYQNIWYVGSNILAVCFMGLSSGKVLSVLKVLVDTLHHPLVNRIWTIPGQCGQKGPYFRDRVPMGTFLTFWVPVGPYLYCRVTIFSVLAKFMQRMSIKSACTQQWMNLVCLWWVNSCTIIVCRYWFCVKLLANHDFTVSYALNFINLCFGSLFWLPVPIGSLFQCSQIQKIYQVFCEWWRPTDRPTDKISHNL